MILLRVSLLQVPQGHRLTIFQSDIINNIQYDQTKKLNVVCLSKKLASPQVNVEKGGLHLQPARVPKVNSNNLVQ